MDESHQQIPRRCLTKQICGLHPRRPTQNLCGWSPRICRVTSSPVEPYIDTCSRVRVNGLWNPRGQLMRYQTNPSSIFQLNNLYLVIFHLLFINIKCRQFESSFFSNIGHFTIFICILKGILN